MATAVRIGCWAGFWGDTKRALDQMLAVDGIDYVVSDYLAEVTMALLARSRQKDPNQGHVQEAFRILAPRLSILSKRGIKAITNAGALNPFELARQLQEEIDRQGLALTVAAVTGDDLAPQLPDFLAAGKTDATSGKPLPPNLATLNVYLGARPIALALDQGADIVITGRCNDAAVVLGPLLHEFGWNDNDFDLLAAGSLIGHLLECGPQSTGGNFTDWASVPGWSNIGYPVAECQPDGTAVITKPHGTGGLVSVGTVSEQMVFELGNPGAYITPDVVCDWTGVTLEQVGPNRVRVAGAKGLEPTETFKISGTANAGYRSVATAVFAGIDAPHRARRAGEALIERIEALLAEDGFEPLGQASIEVVGAGDLTGNSSTIHAEEAVLKVGVSHELKAALDIFADEFVAFALVAQGMTGLFAGRPRVSPVFSVYHGLIAKGEVPAMVHIGERSIPAPAALAGRTRTLGSPELPASAARTENQDAAVSVPLRTLAFARSGDKGNDANIGVIARHRDYVPILEEQLSTERVASAFQHYGVGAVRRWSIPGIDALNFILEEVLGGDGGTSSLRYDAQGKSYAATLLSLPITVPESALSHLRNQKS